MKLNVNKNITDPRPTGGSQQCGIRICVVHGTPGLQKVLPHDVGSFRSIIELMGFPNYTDFSLACRLTSRQVLFHSDNKHIKSKNTSLSF